jgi:hypothetical protein
MTQWLSSIKSRWHYDCQVSRVDDTDFQVSRVDDTDCQVSRVDDTMLVKYQE